MRTVLSVFAILCALVAVLLGLACWAVPVGAQEHSHEGEVGRYYETWQRPDNRYISCCNKQDCAPAKDVKRVNGTWMMLRWDDVWMEVPDSKIENYRDDARDSPDGRSHLCSIGTFVFCAVLGNGM